MLGKILLAICVLIPLIAADIYMHNPRGSNNRNCEFTPNGNANNNVGNANRLFRSENNGEGGYNCPQARDRNSDPNKAILVQTPKMYYYVGSKLKIEWTAQHACGGNNHCQIVLQYTCGANVRDGVPNPDSNDGNERQGTGTITQATKDSPFYGMHEPYEHYKNCATRSRNKGLFTGVVQVNGESARFTRQNGNGNDYGFECQEERDYYPYWHTSPWKDIAIFTSNTSMCEWYQTESQNVKSRFECVGKDGTTGTAQNNRQECLAAGNEWKEFPAFGIAAPECRSTDEVNTSDNHLGNTANGEMASYWWTIPNDVNENCAFRVRYNITTGEFHPFETDSTKNGPNSPVKTTTNSNGNYYTDLGYGWEMAVKMNPNQLGRTFQDRSFVFQIKARPTNVDANANIINFNIRGKRGNLVNIYPATEYDFVPNKVNLNGGDYLHIQWTGSDFNQNREPNNAEGGPKVPLTNAANNYAADRHNLVQLDTQQANVPRRAEHVSMFLKEDGSKNMDLIKKLALLDQPFDDPSDTVVCKNYTQLLTLTGNNANNANLHHQNCAKLAGAKTPYFDAGLVRMVASGTFTVGSTRNNNFSNRSQKSVITVTNGWYASASKTSAGVAIGFAMIAALVALLL